VFSDDHSVAIHDPFADVQLKAEGSPMTNCFCWAAATTAIASGCSKFMNNERQAVSLRRLILRFCGAPFARIKPSRIIKVRVTIRAPFNKSTKHPKSPA